MSERRPGITLVLGLALLLTLAGCGHKGPLYRPGAQEPTAEPQEQQEAQEEEREGRAP